MIVYHVDIMLLYIYNYSILYNIKHYGVTVYHIIYHIIYHITCRIISYRIVSYRIKSYQIIYL